MRNTMLVAGLLAALTLPAGATTLFSNDFDGGAAAGAGVTVTMLSDPGTLEAASVGAWNARGWANNYYANRSAGDPATATTLGFGNLAPHSMVSLSMILGFLESWDSQDGACCSPDVLDIYVDGVSIARLTANNASGSVEDFDGAAVVAHYAQVNGNDYVTDTLIDVGSIAHLTFMHTGATLELSIQASGPGWQGGTDEAWGMDDLRLTYDALPRDVPAPDVLALLPLALAGLLRRACRC